MKGGQGGRESGEKHDKQGPQIGKAWFVCHAKGIGEAMKS